MPEYLPRIVDRELELRLEASGATLIVGPKWCGKTTTGEQKAKSILKMIKRTVIWLRPQPSHHFC